MNRDITLKVTFRGFLGIRHTRIFRFLDVSKDFKYLQDKDKGVEVYLVASEGRQT